uniref:Polyadenylate-binding protein-interacting protein 10-like isoform X3 n=1 Tax=Rhizophora mucronata TaxID=61149 RepID=A0A2P2JN30_RHIMU
MRGRTGVFDGLTLIGSDPKITPLQLRATIALAATVNSMKAIQVE